LGGDAGEENPLKSTSIARRVHTRISSENLVGEASPGKEKEWKRTLACKLYEERIQLKLLRDRAVVGACSGDDMDMLWEAYETGGGSSAAAGDTKRGGSSKAKRGNAQEESVDGGESEEETDVDEEGPVRQLCCLQALKFSTRKMNLGGGKPSLAKISKVLKRMTALSRVGSSRNLKR
jgi:ribosomal protein L12E/L44/L45/RPP1/RPP2